MMSAMPKGTVQLYLVRHAHAGDAARWTGDDALRPLSTKGRLQTERLARHLAAIHVSVDVVLSSPRVRAQETADPIARALGMEVRLDDRLAGGLTADVLERLLADVGDPGIAMLVGHDPDFSELVADLSGASTLTMRKGALARLDADRPLRSGAAILRWLIPPDALAGEDAG